MVDTTDMVDDDALLEALGIDVAPQKASAYTPREERIIAGFEDILRFHHTHGRPPQHGQGCDIFERLYAVRLDQLQRLPEAQTLLAELDTPQLLGGGQSTEIDEDALLAELGVADQLPKEVPQESDITLLRHVRSTVEKRTAEEIADRTPCQNFERFSSLFTQVEQELKLGIRKTLRFGRDASVVEGNYFILGGQLAYVAEVGEVFKAPNGENDARLRVIYANGTESNLLRRSLQRALYKDEAGRRLSEPDTGPLFSSAAEPDDIETGTIYVLRSQSNHPFVAEHRELIHKIGVTGGDVEARIAGAENQSTYLLAKVEIVATYKLHNINRVKLENLFHRILGAAQLDLTIEDRFGKPVKPREWFLFPLHIINEVVQHFVDGTVTGLVYDPQSASLHKASPPVHHKSLND